MKVFAAPIKGTAPNAAVAWSVEVDVNAASSSSRRTACSARRSNWSTATDSKGKVIPGERQRVNLKLKPDTLARAKAAASVW